MQNAMAKVVVVRFYVENMARMVIDDIDVSLGLFVLLFVV